MALYAKFGKVTDVYDNYTVNEIFMEGADPSICHCLREYWIMHPQAGVTNIVFKAHFLLAIQKYAAKPASHSNQATSRKPYEARTWNNPAPHATEIGS